MQLTIRHNNIRGNLYANLLSNSVSDCQVWNEPFESEGVSAHIMPIPDDYRSTDGHQVYFLNKKTGNLSRYSGEDKIAVYLGDHYPKTPKSNWKKGYTFQKCVRCGVQSVSRSPRIKIQNLETSGEQPLSNIVAELFQGQPEKPDIPAELTRKIPNKGKKVLVFSDSRDKASRLAANLQGDVELDSFRSTVFKSLSEQFSGQKSLLLDGLRLDGLMQILLGFSFNQAPHQ